MGMVFIIDVAGGCISTVPQFHSPTFVVAQYTMDNIANGTTYTDSPSTALVEETGLSSTPVSELPTGGSAARPTPPMPYHCKSAITFSVPELTSFHLNSSNYAEAYAESLTRLAAESHEQSPTVEDPESSLPHAF
jgi:hypothetical protein